MCLLKKQVKKNGMKSRSKKYLDETKDKLDPIEGIYSVSSDNTDKSILGLLSPNKKSNDFARVAILKNNKGFSPQFVELLLEGFNLPKYTKTAESRGFKKVHLIVAAVST